MHTASPAPASRNRAIDGLRAIAVSAVFAYHLFPTFVPGGYLGVDLFFVLSGFLITSLLVRERVLEAAVSLKGFWIRRARRILPAALTVMLATCSAALLVSPDLRVNLWQQVLGIVTFSTNWVQILTGSSYFDSTIPQLFVHYWSLAVEEQFYLIWPLALLGLWALARRADRSSSRVLGGVVISLAVLSALGMALGYREGEDPSALYYGTHTHAFGLLLGAALAVALTSTHPSRLAARWTARRLPWRSSAMWNVVTSTALLVFLIACFWLSDTSAIAYRGGIFVVCVAVMVLIAAAALGHSVWAGLLSHPALVWIGQRSYSMYLWHWPVFVILTVMLDSAAARQAGLVPVLTIALTMALSALSYRLIERPFQLNGFRATIGWRRRHPETDSTPRRADTAVPRLVPRRQVPATARQAAAQSAARGQRHQWRSAVVGMTSLLLLALAGLSTYAVGTAPQQTSIQQQLEQAAIAGSEPVSSQLPVSEPKPLPAGDTISVIGDSVTLGSTESIVAQFPGMTDQQVNAEVSRSYIQVPGIIEQLQASGILRPVVILALGANGPAGSEYVNQSLDMIGPDHIVVVVNAYSPLPANADINAGIAEAAQGRSNVELADWYSAIAERPELLAADQVHPIGQEGQDLYATVIREALQRLVDRQPA